MGGADKPILIVGAGFAGAVHARELADNGFSVEVIDCRAHIGGNAYDEVDPNGVRVHRYGPHLFHTSNQRVVDWLSRFCTFLPYEHRVSAQLADGRRVPLPVNRQTINATFGVSLQTPEEVRTFLAAQAEPIADPANAGEHLISKIGRTLTDLFFRPYTRKMWGLELEEMDAAVIKRIPLREDDEDRYFPSDSFQALPEGGYTQVFERIFDHPAITVRLNQPFEKAMLDGARHCFNSMPIDAFFDTVFGPLPYRSIRFHHRSEPISYGADWTPTVNFTDDGPYTRQTDWSLLPGHRVIDGPLKTVTIEEPCHDFDNAMERYYPVKTSDGRFDAAYQSYKALAAQTPNVTFIGRCGTYQYLDMHQVINQSLQSVRAWMAYQISST